MGPSSNGELRTGAARHRSALVCRAATPARRGAGLAVLAFFLGDRGASADTGAGQSWAASLPSWRLSSGCAPSQASSRARSSPSFLLCRLLSMALDAGMSLDRALLVVARRSAGPLGTRRAGGAAKRWSAIDG